MVSYSDVFSLKLERDHDEDIAPGDLVRTGSSQHPQYHVIAIHGDKVWLRHAQNGHDAVTLLNRCRKITA
jgi:hypothetical protein